MKSLPIFAGVMASCTMAMSADRPNVLFLAIDDLRPELKCYGAPQVKTPNIDRLASQGVRFERAYCQVPVCGASRASLLTSMLPTRTRFVNYQTRADKDVPDAATLPQVFKDAGYTTLSNGKIFHHRDDCEAKSWSEPAWRPKGGHSTSLDPTTTEQLSKRKRGRIYELPDVPDDAYPDGKIATKTIEDLRRLKKAGKPFFLACGFVRPHLPFYAPKRYWDMYQRDEIKIADNRYRPSGAPAALRGSGEFRSYHLAGLDTDSEEFHRVMRHGYMASVSYVDQLVGNVLSELERLDLADNTIVVLWGDHGWHLGEHNFWGKHNTMHLAMRVPLIVKLPQGKAGASAALVETSDIFPTLCSLAHVDIPATAHGKSFKEVLENPEAAFRDVIYSRFGSADAVVTERFTYTSYQNGKSEMMYDLKNDPDENQNVADKKEYYGELQGLRRLVAQRIDEAVNRSKGQAMNEKAEAESTVKQEGAPGYEGDVPVPTYSEVSYGPHERHVLDFWQAKSGAPTPLALVIHGGGWVSGNKERLSRFADVNALLASGISVAAINYRLMKHAEGVEPPVKAPMHDSARALQFLRSKAAEWNIDPDRIGAAGGSAGACTSLWLAYHDDLADAEAVDPVARQSTRLTCAAVTAPQTSLDPEQMKEWTPNSRYGAHAFGKKDFAQFLSERDSILPWIAEYSPYALVTKDDPPVFLFYRNAPAMGEKQKDPTHTANFGVALQRRCKEVGAECVLHCIGAEDVEYSTPTEFLIAKLKKSDFATDTK